MVLSALSLLCACTKEVTGSIASDVDRLDVPAGMGTYHVGIKADCSWSAELRDEAGEVPAWADLTKSLGSGNDVIGIKVYENKYNVERRAVLNVIYAGGAVALSIPVVQSSAGGDGTLSEDFRIGSYNLRMSGLDKDNDNVWAVRKERLAKSIRENEFDVFGVQEASSEQQNWLRTEFASEYECWFFSPYAAGGAGDKAHGILYRKGSFTLSDPHFFWMGEDPHTMSKSDTGTNGDFCRGGCCATITHRASGIRFFFMCTHACLNREPNNKYSVIYGQMEKEYNTEGLPSFFVGDMNAQTTHAAYSVYAAYWKDAYVNATSKKGPANTYNGYKTALGSSRIDYVFYRGSGIRANEYVCNNNRFNALYASDHFPIYLDCTITVNN